MTRRDNGNATYLVAHPGAELFGSDRMALESVRGFVEHGAKVIVALPERGPLVDELRKAGADVTVIPMLVLRKRLLSPAHWGELLGGLVRGTLAAVRVLRRWRPTAVYVSTITLPMWPLVARAARIPVISHVHEAEASGSALVNKVVYGPHLASRKLVVNSSFSLQTMSEAFPRLRDRTEIVYNGVEGPANPSPPRAELDDLRVLFIGRLSPRKGPDVAIRACNALQARGRSVRLTVLGSSFPGYEWFEQELHTLAASARVGVDFLGFQPDIWPVLDRHDVLVVPSRLDEPFGNTAVEGVLGKRPVMASDTSGLREAARDYSTTALVPPGDDDALADALEHVVRDWDTLRDQVEISAHDASQRHSPSAYRERVAGIVAAACVRTHHR